MRKLQKRHYVLIFLIAFLAGIFLRGVENSSFEIVNSSTANAPELDVVYAESNQDDAKKININQADVGELDKLHGIGESLAKRIIQYRTVNGNFEVIEDIMKVSGIGEKTFEDIKNQICVE